MCALMQVSELKGDDSGSPAGSCKSEQGVP
jgi:hypothetical protein